MELIGTFELSGQTDQATRLLRRLDRAKQNEHLPPVKLSLKTLAGHKLEEREKERKVFPSLCLSRHIAMKIKNGKVRP